MTDSYISLRPPQIGFLIRVPNPHITLAYFKDVSPDELRDALPESISYPGRVVQFTGAGIWRGQVAARPEYWTSYHSVETTTVGYPLKGLRDIIVKEANLFGLYADDTYPFTPHITQRVTGTYREALEKLDVSTQPNKFGVRDLYISSPGNYLDAYSIPLA